MSPPGPIMIARAVFAWVFVCGGAVQAAEIAGPSGEPPAAVLERCGIEPSAAGVSALLARYEPTPEQLARITALVKQLGDDRYYQRERATRELLGCCPVAVPQLRSAQKSPDLEVAHRAGEVLLGWNRDGRCRHEAALTAALQWLKDSPTPQATGLLLRVLPHLPEALARGAGCEALWSCVGPADAAEVRRAIEQPSLLLREMAIPALEVAVGEAAVDFLSPYLQAAEARVRLAAARALLDRTPREAVAALLELVASDDQGVRLSAGWLLQQVSGIPAEGHSETDLDAAVPLWHAWAAGSPRWGVVGRRRLEPTLFGIIFAESFDEDASEIEQAYHRLACEKTDAAASASVAGGVLRLHGDRPECDQRLCITAVGALGEPVFPPTFRVKAAVGGDGDMPGAWHVGVSVGNVRVLFHPGMRDGAFRIERVDNHAVIVPNQQMFTPRGGTLHDMTIDVQRREDGVVRLSVRVADRANTFTRACTIEAADIGPVRRIGLERSGRNGGAALFGSFEIVAWTPPEP